MKILHISDTHGYHCFMQSLPPADVLVHSGDFTFGGSEEEALDFLNWFLDQPYRHKVLIAGNHDDCLYDSEIEGLDPNCHYLCYSQVEIDGVKFFGLPMFVEDDINGLYEKEISKIPADTDVLVSHQPPKGILDYDDGIHYGSTGLRAQVEEIKPHLHLFGHIHKAHGIYEGEHTTFVNSAVIDENYAKLSTPNMIEI